MADQTGTTILDSRVVHQMVGQMRELIRDHWAIALKVGDLMVDQMVAQVQEPNQDHLVIAPKVGGQMVDQMGEPTGYR